MKKPANEMTRDELLAEIEETTLESLNTFGFKDLCETYMQELFHGTGKRYLEKTDDELRADVVSFRESFEDEEAVSGKNHP